MHSRRGHTDFRVCPDQPGPNAGQVPAAERKPVVLAGGSHDPQYFDAIREIADAQGWELLNQAGIPVIGLRDNPRFTYKVPECLETSEDPNDCGVPRRGVYGDSFPAGD